MCLRWAAVILTSLGFAGAACALSSVLSALDEQPPTEITIADVITAIASARGKQPRRAAAVIPGKNLLFICILNWIGLDGMGLLRTRLLRIGLLKIRAVPPATAKRLEQRRRVDVTIGLRLHQADPRLLIRLLR